jgi:hypothetical protein
MQQQRPAGARSRLLRPRSLSAGELGGDLLLRLGQHPGRGGRPGRAGDHRAGRVEAGQLLAGQLGALLELRLQDRDGLGADVAEPARDLLLAVDDLAEPVRDLPEPSAARGQAVGDLALTVGDLAEAGVQRRGPVAPCRAVGELPGAVAELGGAGLELLLPV